MNYQRTKDEVSKLSRNINNASKASAEHAILQGSSLIDTNTNTAKPHPPFLALSKMSEL